MKKYLVTILVLLLGVQSMTGALLVYAEESTDLLIASVHTEASEISPVQSERVVQKDATEFYLASIYVTNWISDTEKETLALSPVYGQGKLKKLLEQAANQELPKSIVSQLNHFRQEATKEQPLQLEKYGLRWFVKVKDTVYVNGEEAPLAAEAIPEGLFDEAFTVRNLYADYMQQSAKQLEQPDFPEGTSEPTESSEPSATTTETTEEQPAASGIVAEPIVEEELPQQPAEEGKENRSSANSEMPTSETTESSSVVIDEATEAAATQESTTDQANKKDHPRPKETEAPVFPTELTELPLVKKLEFSMPILPQARAFSLNLFSSSQLPTYIPMNVQDEKSGKLTQQKPKDYYKIQLPAVSDKYGIQETIISCVSSFDSYGTLYDAKWNEVAANDNGNRNNDFRLKEVLKGGTYYLEVRGYSRDSSGAYQIKSKQVKKSDPNHSFATATSIKLGDEIEGEIEIEKGWLKRNYYKFTLPPLSKTDYFVEDTISITGNYIFYGTLYNSEFEKIASEKMDWDGDCEIRKTLEGGTYYLEVGTSATIEHFGTYKISTKHQTNGDQNYSFETAEPLKVNSSCTGKIERGNRLDDVDYYKIEIPKDGKYRMDSENDFYFRATLYAQDQKQVMYTTDRLVRTVQFDRILAKGTYYLRIRGFAQSCIGSYKLKLNLMHNDVEAIDFNKFYEKKVKPAKEQFYKITVTKEGNYKFDFDSDDSVTLCFFDEKKDLTEKESYPSEDEKITFTKKLAAGTYYVQLVSQKNTEGSFIVSPNYYEDLKEYEVYALMLKNPETGKKRVFWRLEKNNKPVDDSSLYKYLDSSGNHLPRSMFTFVDREKMNQIEEGYLKAGYHPTTGEEVPSWVLPIIYSSYLMEDGYQFVTESELGNALLTLGYVYSMYRLATVNGTKQIEKASGLTKAQKVENFQNRINDIRNKMPNNPLKKRGNMAAADVNIKGLPEEFVAHSKINSNLDKGADVGNFSTLKPEGERIFKNYEPSASSIDGTKFDRFHDTEAKILEDIASKIKDPNTSGSIDLFTELPACQSCSNIILEFRKKFPNIKLNIFTK